MGDLNYIDRTGEVKITGQDATGLGVNYVTADANGNLAVKDYSDGPVTPGTVAATSALIGGQFNTALPTLTSTQQSAIQLDSSGRIIVRNSEFPATVDTNYGTVGASTLRTASQIGNATGSADFNAGNSSAQTLRVVIASNQVAIPVSQSGTWTTGRTWTLASGTDSVSVVQSTSPWVTKDQSDGPVTPGAVASFSQLAGGQYNSTPPTLTTGQQSALQLDSAGRLLVDSAVTFPYDENYGTVGANTLRTASQIGNATGAADFNAGAATAQTLRVTGSNFPTTVDTNFGTVGASTIRVASEIGNATGAANFNYGTVGAQTVRAAAQIGNATGAADFNAGASGAQTLRVASNLYDGSANAITSTASEAKRALDVIINAPTKATYSAATGLFSPPATPTDMWVMQGSATKVVKILKIRLDFTQTTAGNNSFYLKRYSTADTGGTPTTVSSFPLDTNYSAATATVKRYTANPTLGTLTGSLDIAFVGVPTNGAPSSAVGTTSYFWDFLNNQGSPLVLRGTSDQIAINFNGAALPGGLEIAVFVMFTEE